MNNKVVQFSNENDFVQSVTDEIVQRIEAKEQGKVFRLALSGGSTPGPIYQELSRRLNIDWSRVELYLVDERYVPLDHPHSNYRMIHEALLRHIHAKKIVYFDTSLPIEECLQKYESNLVPTEEKFFDVILLGIGNDGHTASLFPNSSALEEDRRWVAHTTTDEFDVRDRLTLTLPALKSAQQRFFLIKGKEKERALERSCEQMLPAGIILKINRAKIFLLT